MVSAKIVKNLSHSAPPDLCLTAEVTFPILVPDTIEAAYTRREGNELYTASGVFHINGSAAGCPADFFRMCLSAGKRRRVR
jgi:hypothetical protein